MTFKYIFGPFNRTFEMSKRFHALVSENFTLNAHTQKKNDTKEPKLFERKTFLYCIVANRLKCT